MLKLPTKTAGFTLVEVLVALSLSAVVATLAYQSLSASADATERSQAVAAQVEAVDRVWQFLERDLRQAVPVPQRSSGSAAPGAINRFGLEDPGFRGEGAEEDSMYAEQGFFLRFRRGGWLNPLEQTRSQLQGVGYRLQEGALYRYHWPILNNWELEQAQLPDDEQQWPALLEGVESVALRFLPADARALNDGAWLSAWPEAGVDSTTGMAPADRLPLAVEMTLTVKDFGVSSRLFYLPAAN